MNPTSYASDARKPFIATLALVTAVAMLASMFFFHVPSAHAADNVLLDISMVDNDADGLIDRAVVTVDNTSVNTAAVHDNTGWSVTYDGNAVTITGVSISSATNADPLVFHVDLDETDTDLAIDTASTNFDVTYTQQGANAGTEYDDAGDVQLVTIGSGETESDGAAPVVASTSPADTGTLGRSGNIVLTFSEAMDTTFVEGTEFTFSPDPGSFTTSASSGDSVITIDPDANLSCDTTYTVTTDETQIDAASGSPTGLLTTGPETGDFSFTVTCSSGSSTPYEEEEKTYEVNVLTPNGGETWEAGSVQEITWETSGTGTISFVNVYYSTDGGASYTLIEKNSSNDGSLDWTLPTTGTADGIVKVAGTDLATEITADHSDSAFTIQTAGDEVTEEPTEETEEPAEEPQEPTEEEMGTSPVTGEPEPITPVSPGDYITSASFPAVYYIDANMVRHPFYDKQAFFTWQDSFDVVKDVTDATLPELELGTPIMPKPGVALVKITTVFDVFAVTQGDSMLDSILRKIDNEDVATSLYGAQWADYVIDIPTTLFEQFDRGPVIDANSTFNPDTSIMKTRMELNE